MLVYLIGGACILLLLCFIALLEIASRLKSIDLTLMAEHQVSDPRFNTFNEHLTEVRAGIDALEEKLESTCESINEVANQ